MVIVIINSGTKGRAGATVENATEVASRICKDLTIPMSSVERAPTADDASDGFFGFTFPGNLEVVIPGDDPDEVCRGQPFVSRRLYVDGSSWLYGYALDAIRGRL